MSFHAIWGGPTALPCARRTPAGTKSRTATTVSRIETTRLRMHGTMPRIGVRLPAARPHDRTPGPPGSHDDGSRGVRGLLHARARDDAGDVRRRPDRAPLQRPEDQRPRTRPRIRTQGAPARPRG